MSLIKAKLSDDISFHSLRHPCGSWVMMSATPMRTVPAMLRHSTLEMTPWYAHLAPESFKNQVEKGFDGL